MSALRRVLLSLLLGMVLGAVGALFVAPGAIGWFATPAIPNAMSCVNEIQWALGKFRLVILGASAVTGLVLMIAVEVLRPKKPSPVAPAAPVAPGPPPSKPA